MHRIGGLARMLLLLFLMLQENWEDIYCFQQKGLELMIKF